MCVYVCVCMWACDVRERLTLPNNNGRIFFLWAWGGSLFWGGWFRGLDNRAIIDTYYSVKPANSFLFFLFHSG